jgi:hypothetical protein
VVVSPGHAGEERAVVICRNRAWMRGLPPCRARGSDAVAGRMSPRLAVRSESVAVKVREALKRIEAAGWEACAHAWQPSPVPPSGRPGVVTVAGKPSDTLHPEDVGEHHKAGWR